MSGRVLVARPGRAASLALAALLVVLASLTTGCYSTQLTLLRSGLDSLRVQVDTLTVRDSIAYRVLADTRTELQSQRDLILSTRASSGSTLSELFDQISALQGKLDEVLHRFTTVVERSGAGGAVSAPAAGGTAPASGGAIVPPAASPVGDPAQAYDLATRDLTEGRYGMALGGYREFLRRFPASDLADNAQYGVGECFFAQAVFDSAAVEYGHVGTQWPKGDRAAAALYKLALCQERLGRTVESRKSFEELVKRFPGSSEAGLAKERLGSSRQ
ncbi:MAG: tol-pal system protein YbgF [Candidatus Eisenbacteria bacterium]|uniref:Tol-pal system protein YbgF n=1 Tax=Eiseniibacteriota bacterium TaxID=2212470 RepID=A0A933SGC2_UNCEI|nr:tol-pal system protein YbgF [Candidatus Eisenbacteria bacterium]